MSKILISLDKCKSCMKKKPEAVAIYIGLYGLRFTVKPLCMDCYKTKKLEGTLFKVD